MHLTGMGVPRWIFLILTLLSSRPLSFAGDNSTEAPTKKTQQESPKKGGGKPGGEVDSYEYHEAGQEEESEEEDEMEEDREYVETLSAVEEVVLVAVVALPYLWILVYMFHPGAFLRDV